MKYICSKCKKIEDVTSLKSKCDCGGLWKLKFHAPKFDLKLVDKNTWGLFRYRKFMPIIDDSWKDITLGEGMTPIIRFDENVLLKMDYFMPTLSFKDRGAAMLISHCKSIGVKSVVQDSSGNAGNSVAAYCAKANIKCEIFVPEGTSPKKINMIRSHNAKVNITPGSRDDCADICRNKVIEEKKYYANHVYNPFFYEGTKTYIYEVYEQLNRIPKNIFVPLGNGTLFIGVIKALEELLESELIETMPNIYAIQSEYCSPFVLATKNSELKLSKVISKPTLAEGIAIGVPMRAEEILEYIYKYNVKTIIAPEDNIIRSREILASKGIYCEHTTAASYAAYLQYCKDNESLSDCLISMCGAGLKSDH
ncbi:threonine synthase [Malaciobacter molluscorum LMG 25693]|uniref:Threonine synthase n=1 Tax=Malaciobacter molluscorum LMG 25693 TaxID=870501 RepID=A0A2G1DKC1_9BACT|nr:threonine synthase [Malaciobacter molluscorum]AXX92539.1 threonine synthase, putative [Malaciobacter molluscorum LMG 25693]PHO18965.1 threonine synthase [Malaciobacter molluscorum LMG 25693]